MSKNKLFIISLFVILCLTACGNEEVTKVAGGESVNAGAAASVTSSKYLKDNPEEAEKQIRMAMNKMLSESYGADITDVRVYIEKIYSTSEEQEIEVLKDKKLQGNETAFEVRYDLKPSKSGDLKVLTATSGKFDDEIGWVTEKYGVGILRQTEDGYVVADFGTGF